MDRGVMEKEGRKEERRGKGRRGGTGVEGGSGRMAEEERGETLDRAGEVQH